MSAENYALLLSKAATALEQAQDALERATVAARPLTDADPRSLALARTNAEQAAMWLARAAK